MCRQGIETFVEEGVTNELLAGAGLEMLSDRPVRKAILHIHLDHPSRRFLRMVSDLDSIPTGHIAWYRGKRWRVADARVLNEAQHAGHEKNKGFACEYFLEEAV
jgi:hypothetical protein